MNAIITTKNAFVPGVARGSVREQCGEFESALKDYADAIRFAPQSPVPYLYRAAVWGEKNEFDKAMNDYAVALRLDPESAGAWAGRARIQAACPDASLRDGKQAVAAATKACSLSHWGVEAWIDTLAAAYAETGDFAQAVKWQQKAIDMLGKSKSGLYQPDESKARLELYQSGQPYRETPKPKLPGKTR